MASIQEVLGVASYQGQGYAGGGVGVSVNLDKATDSFQKFADFKMYQNKAAWEKKNSDDAAAALEMAKYIAIDPSTTIDQQREPLRLKKQEIDEILKDPSVLYYQENPEGYTKLHKSLSEFDRIATPAKANDVLKAKYDALIEKETDINKRQALREYQKLKLDHHFGNDGAKALLEKGVIPSLDDVDADAYKFTETPYKTYETTQKLPNSDKIVKLKIKDASSAWASSVTDANEFMKNGNMQFEKEIENPQTEAEKKENEEIKFRNQSKILRKKAGLDSGGLSTTVDAFNSYKDKYFAQKEALANWEKESDENKKLIPKPVIEDPMKLGIELDSFNTILDEYDNAIAILAQTNPDLKNVPKAKRIDLSDSLSLEELIYMRKIIKDKQGLLDYSDTSKQTNLGLEYAQLAEQKSNNKGNRAIEWSKLDLEKKKLLSNPPAAEVDVNSPDYSGNVIYGVNFESGSISIINGVVYDKVTGKKVENFNGTIDIPEKQVLADVKTVYADFNKENKSKIDNKGGVIKYTFKDGVASTVMTTNGSPAGVEEFGAATNWKRQQSETKWRSDSPLGTVVGKGKGAVPATNKPAATSTAGMTAEERKAYYLNKINKK